MESKILSIMNFKLTFDTRYTHACSVIENHNTYISGSSRKKFKSMVAFMLELSLLGQFEDFSEN